MDQTVCQSLPEKLHVAGFFHPHRLEKGDTGGGVTANRSLSDGLLMRSIEGRERQYITPDRYKRVGEKCRLWYQWSIMTECSLREQLVKNDNKRLQAVEPI